MERLWILILAGVSFLAGGAAGLYAAPRFEVEVERSLFDGYKELLIAEFGLNADQQSNLNWFLAVYERRLEDLKARHWDELEEEVARAGNACYEGIRTHVIPPERSYDYNEAWEGNLLSGPPPSYQPRHGLETN